MSVKYFVHGEEVTKEEFAARGWRDWPYWMGAGPDPRDKKVEVKNEDCLDLL